ncbi:MAG: pyridoxine 5'-phosphate synthase [Acidobacteriaceae bacterium]|jgi:pyridoxine 5-phosphate synthase|nr:pyridoxine 5'-phosphate synthase [Acidobacteriaceae bacterium]
MVRLSVNVNKIATLRNSRGGSLPRVLDAVRVAVDAGVHGITVHPRHDQRHITPVDVREIAAALAPMRPKLEFNIEGDPRPDLIALVREVVPEQCTLVPVVPGEITSQAGWTADAAIGLAETIADLKSRGIRVSVFVDATEQAVALAHGMGADRIELYTEPFARAFEQGETAARASFDTFARAARLAHSLGVGVNAGHDLDLDNLLLFRDLPYLDEVSIGHAIVSRAVFVGLDRVVREYLAVLAGGSVDSGSGMIESPS